MTKFRIDVVSDTVCPWCFVGRKQVQRAQQIWQQRYPSSNDTFVVQYAPFQLNPDAPRGPSGSIDKQEYLQAKFGVQRSAQMHDRMTGLGKGLGINFSWGGKLGNSRDSHRLVYLAKKYGNETELKVVDGLFSAFFEKEQDIADYGVLKSIATGAGISEAEFNKAIVESDEGGKEVDTSAGTARYRGVYGVPDYTIQGRFKLSGAQDAMEFVNVFERVKAQEAS